MDPINPSTDVTGAASTSAADSSTETKPVDTETVTEPAVPAGDTTTKETNQAVPYDRFKEVNDELKTVKTEMENLKARVPAAPTPPIDEEAKMVTQKLKELGFISKDELQQIERQRNEDAKVQAELTRLEGVYNGTDGKPKFDRKAVIGFALDRQIGDLEAAYKTLHYDALMDAAIKNAVSKSGGVVSEASDGSGAKGVGTTNTDLKDAIKKGDRNALKTLLKRQFTPSKE